MAAAEAQGINLRRIDEDTVGISADETTTPDIVAAVAEVFGARSPAPTPQGFGCSDAAVLRTSEYMQHPVFNTHRSETQLLRYIRKLSRP